LNKRRLYDIGVIGAGPAGIMAAICAARQKRDVVLLERNDRVGKKILITGKGRCNLTNTASLDTFIEKFGKQGLFLRPAFSVFFNEGLMEFFKSRGLPLKKERQGRVFPSTDTAESVVHVLNNCLKKNYIKVLYNSRVSGIRKREAFFELDIENKNALYARKIVLATGGSSYKATGSSGDGYQVARKLKHDVLPLTPALVPLKTCEKWVKELQGLTLKNIRLTFLYGKKKIVSGIGEMLFTHFGVSGPLVLDLSGRLVALLEEHREIRLLIDLKPGLEPVELEARLLREFRSGGKSHLKNVLKELLPHRLIPVFLHLSVIDSAKTASQITKSERARIMHLLKALPLTISGALGIEYGMVTNGGISTKEINPKTMESKRVPGLYFAGEIIDGRAPSGGYNLQQAFSTGFLAGDSALAATSSNP